MEVCLRACVLLVVKVDQEEQLASLGHTALRWVLRASPVCLVFAGVRSLHTVFLSLLLQLVSHECGQ